MTLVTMLASLGVLLSMATAGDPSAAAQRSAERMVVEMIERNHEAYMEFVYPGLIELVGGDDVFLALLMGSDATLDDYGFSIESCTVIGVDSVVEHEGRSFAVVLETIHLRGPQGCMETESFVLGVLDPEASDWKFIDGAGLRADPATLDSLFPGLLLRLELPARGVDRIVTHDER